MNKKQQRQIIKERLRSITSESMQENDRKICQNILSLPEYQQAETIFCFVNTADEIDTSIIFADAWKAGKKTVVPLCIDKGWMKAYEINSFQELEPGAYGILEPKKDCPEIASENIDFAVIPCMSCDLSGRRLGHGGGYYDRYLEGTTFTNAIVCREILLLEKIITEAHDKQMDIVVTESQVLRPDIN